MRVLERSSLTPEELIRLIDADAGIPVATYQGGRYVRLLVYSPGDDDLLTVIQDTRNRGILTLMPLDYVKNRTTVTGTQKRSARNRACQCLGVRKPAPRTSATAALVGSSGWKIHQMVDSRFLSREHVFTGAKYAIQRPGRLQQKLVIRLDEIAGCV